MERLTYRSPGLRNPVSYGACEDVKCRGVCDQCKIGAIVSKLCDYEDTGLKPEEIANWVYSQITPPDGTFEETMQEVEKALGFRLFAWQKTYIAQGKFRKYGATTAEILRDLLDASAEPIDYSRRETSKTERFYREELRAIKERLDNAGIPTRTVFFSEREKRDYLSRQKEGKPWDSIL